MLRGHGKEKASGCTWTGLVALLEGPGVGRLSLRYSPLFWWPRPRLGHTAESALGSASGFRPSLERPSMRHLFITFHPRFTIAHPMWVIMDRRLHTGVTITGYTIIVIAAVAINPTMHGAVWSISPAPAASPAASPADMIAVPRLIRHRQDGSKHPDPRPLALDRSAP